MLAWCLEAFVASANVRRVAIAIVESERDEFERAISEFGSDLEVLICGGGRSRSHSVREALRCALAEWGEPGAVLVHDAARPLASAGLIDAGIAELDRSGADAVVPAAPVADTIKQTADGDHVVTATLDRSTLWAVQTPQFFNAASLTRAMDVPDEQLAAATDDASLVEQAGGRVVVMPCAEPNPKVTTAADLEVVGRMLLHGAT